MLIQKRILLVNKKNPWHKVGLLVYLLLSLQKVFISILFIIRFFSPIIYVSQIYENV